MGGRALGAAAAARPGGPLVTLAGARLRLQAPLLLGGAVLVVDALHELAPYVAQVAGALPRWATPALVGLALLGLGATNERRLGDVHRVRAVLGRTRQHHGRERPRGDRAARRQFPGNAEPFASAGVWGTCLRHRAHRNAARGIGNRRVAETRTGPSRIVRARTAPHG
ncbi:SCO7613 C-terminal domain-containing membrane protein [Streptomyces sulfonofaciens]